MNVAFDKLVITYPLTLSMILDGNMECSFGDHPAFWLKAVIPDDKGATYVNAITQDTELKVARKKKDSLETIFCGYTDSVKVYQEGGLYIANIHAVAYTAKLDTQKKSRTFFKKGVTYHEILEAVTEDYKGVQMKELVKTKRATAFPILQYEETDWEFIKRIAAMFEAVVTPDCTESVPRFYIGRHKRDGAKEFDKEAEATYRDLKYCYEDYFQEMQAFSILKQDAAEEEAKQKKKEDEKKKKALAKQAKKRKKSTGAIKACEMVELSDGVSGVGQAMDAPVEKADMAQPEDFSDMLPLMSVDAQGLGEGELLLSALTPAVEGIGEMGALMETMAAMQVMDSSAGNATKNPLKENLFTFYTIQSRSYYPLGTMITMKNGEKGMVSHIDGYTEREEVWYEYIIREPKGIVARYENNPNLAGVSLVGTVKKRIGNMVSLNLEIDQDDGYQSSKEDYFFTYALETKDYYCMPVEGATVHLYFPTGKEWEAIAVNSLRNEADGNGSRGGKISNPDNRSLSNDFGVSLDLTPDHINFTPHDANTVSIKLEKNGDITLAGKNISISAKEIELGKAESEDGEVICKSFSIEAGSTVFFSRLSGEGESVAIIEDHVMGLESYTQIVSTDKILHETTGTPRPPAVSYDETALQQQEKEQIDAQNKQIEDTLIERKKNALGKFATGLLMCAVGAALIVATGGVAGVVIGAGMAVFGAAEMSEAADSRALAESGDWSTPAKNALKDALGEPAYTILKSGFVIAGSIVTAGMLGVGAGSILAAGAVNTGISMVFDLIPDGKLDTSLLDYLDSFATGTLIAAVTGPIGKIGNCNTITKGMEFATRFGQQMASSTLYALTSGELDLQRLGEMGVREAVSSLIAAAMPKGTSKLVKTLLDTGADTFVDSAEQLYNIWKNGGSLSDFDFKRLVQTAATSAVNNMLFTCDPVNCVRGNLFCFREDLSSKDLYGDFTFQRRYDSVLQFKGSMGNGWIHEYETMIQMENKETIVVLMPDSHVETFIRQADGSWLNQNSGTRVYELSVHEDKGWIELTSREGGEYRRYRYDQEGRLTAIYDRMYQREPVVVHYTETGLLPPMAEGAVSSVARKQHRQIDRITSPGGRTMYFTYENGYVVSVKDSAGREVHYEYEKGCLVKAHYTTGGKQVYCYDKAGKLVSMSGEDGRAFLKNVYDEKGRVVRQEYPDGNFCGIAYEDRKRFTTFTFSESGRQERYFYDGKERIVKTQWRQGKLDGKGSADGDTSGSRDNRMSGGLAGRRTADGEALRRMSGGLAGRRKIPENSQKIRGVGEHAASDKVLHLPTEFETQYEESCVYDQWGNKIEETDKNGNVTKRTYDQWGGMLSEVLADGSERHFAYNDSHKLSREWNSSGSCTEYEYDERGNLTAKKVWLSKTQCAVTTYWYDAYGRQVSMCEPMGQEIRYVYDGTSVNQPSVVENPDGSRYRYGYDEAGRQTSITTEYGQVQIGYSETGEETLIIDALGNTTRKYVDAAGNILKLVPPNLYKGEGEQSIGYTYEYDYLDRQIEAVTPDGTVLATPVDMDGNVKKEISPDGYDPKTKDGWGITYEYDCCQYKVKETTAEGNVRRYLYDGNGNIVKVIQPEEYALHGEDGSGISYTYNCRNQLTSVVDEDGNVVRHFVYDDAGHLVKEMDAYGYASGENDEERYGTLYRYNRAGWLVECREPVKVQEDTGEMLYCVTGYEYDLNGNRVLEKRSNQYLTETQVLTGGLEIHMEYDSRNRLVKVSDNLGAAMEYTYDSLNNRTSEKARINENKYRMVFYDYDACGRLAKTRQAVDFEDLGEEPKKYVKKAFAIIEYGYDKNGNVTSITLPEGGKILREYDVCDRLVKETMLDEANGIHKVTAFTYDKSGRVTSETDGFGYSVKTDYDKDGNPIRRTDKNGAVSRYFYDKDGNVVKEVRASNYDAVTDDGVGTSYTYDGFGRVLTVTNALGFVEEENTYDLAGRLVKKADGLGTLVEYSYDAGGRIAEVRVPWDGKEAEASDLAKKAAEQNQNAKNQLDKVIHLSDWKASLEFEQNQISKQTYRYDARGNITGITDGEGNQTSYEVDAWGRITAIQKPDGSRETFTYDYAGNVATTADGNGGTITYDYNSLGKLGSITDQAGDVEKFFYDRMENLAGHDDRDGRKTRYRYQMLGGLLYQKAVASGELYTYEYDAEGQMTKACGGGVDYQYQYTADGNVAAKLRNGKPVLSYSYNLDGNVESLVDVTGKETEYTYDVLGRAVKVTDGGKVLATYGYHDDGSLASVKFGNGMTTQYQYHGGRNIASLETRNPDGSVLMAFQYGYDGNGNRTVKAGVQDGKASKTRYGYDALQRIQKAVYPDGGWETFAYDKAGNRTERLTGAWKETYEYDVRNRLEKRKKAFDVLVYGSQRNGGAGAGGRLDVLEFDKELAEERISKVQQKLEKVQYRYDCQGNTVAEETWNSVVGKSNVVESMVPVKRVSYAYNEFNRPAQVEIDKAECALGSKAETKDGLKHVYTQENFYDAENFRYGIMENGKRTDFISNGWDVFAEQDDKGQVVNRLVRGYGIVAAELSTGTDHRVAGQYCYYHMDEHGDVGYITDEIGVVKNRYTYDAFGSTVRADEVIRNRYRYNGELYDSGTEQYYLRARFYNPVMARFTQEDVYRGDGLNLYAYCGNNAVGYEDPSGYAKCKTSKKIADSIDEKIKQAESAQAKAQELSERYGYGEKPRKTVASNGDINTLSGWKKLSDNSEFTRVKPEKVIDKSNEIGHNLRNAGANDQGVPGKYNASHAEKQLSILSDKPIGISQPMCSDCQEYFKKLSVSENKMYVTADPKHIRVFYPDGTVMEKER